jgi:hypothetical protein
MAISLQKAGGNPNTFYCEFYCDLISEIDLLPTTITRGVGEYSSYGACPMGSSAYCFENGEAYALSSTGWKIV